MKSFRDPLHEWLKEKVGAAANPMVTELDKLTDQQFLFCCEYVKTGSARKAAVKSKMRSATNPDLLLHLPKVAACVNILHARREAELGKKSSAEIVERLNNTVLIEADDFDFSDDAVQEREAKLNNKTPLNGASTNELVDNVMHANVDNGIAQLPKIRVPAAQSFGPQWVIERCVTVAERCLQIEPVYDRKGRPIGQFQFNAPGALKALEMLGKTMAMFKDKIEVSHEVSGFTDDELDSRLKTLTQQFPEFQGIIDGEVERAKQPN